MSGARSTPAAGDRAVGRDETARRLARIVADLEGDSDGETDDTETATETATVAAPTGTTVWIPIEVLSDLDTE